MTVVVSRTIGVFAIAIVGIIVNKHISQGQRAKRGDPVHHLRKNPPDVFRAYLGGNKWRVMIDGPKACRREKSPAAKVRQGIEEISEVDRFEENLAVGFVDSAIGTFEKRAVFVFDFGEKLPAFGNPFLEKQGHVM